MSGNKGFIGGWVLWWLGALASIVFWVDLEPSGLRPTLMIALGLGALALGLWSANRARRQPLLHGLTATAFALALVCAFQPFHEELGIQSYLLRHQGEYAARMAAHEQGRTDGRMQVEKDIVGFDWSIAADFWRGAVHDPDDALEERVGKQLFYLRLVSARPLGDRWYYCTLIDPES